MDTASGEVPSPTVSAFLFLTVSAFSRIPHYSLIPMALFPFIVRGELRKPQKLPTSEQKEVSPFPMTGPCQMRTHLRKTNWNRRIRTMLKTYPQMISAKLEFQTFGLLILQRNSDWTMVAAALAPLGLELRIPPLARSRHKACDLYVRREGLISTFVRHRWMPPGRRAA